MKKTLITLIALTALFSCKKNNDSDIHKCTCKARCYTTQGFTKDTVITTQKAYPAGTTTDEARTQCGAGTFWPTVGSTSYITNPSVGNGYVSEIDCGL